MFFGLKWGQGFKKGAYQPTRFPREGLEIHTRKVAKCVQFSEVASQKNLYLQPFAS